MFTFPGIFKAGVPIGLILDDIRNSVDGDFSRTHQITRKYFEKIIKY